MMGADEGSGMAMKNDQRRKHGKLRGFLLVIFAFLFCLSAYQVSKQLLTESKEKQAFEELIGLVGQDRPTRPVQTATPSTPVPTSPVPTVTATPEPPGMGNPAQSDEPQALATAEPVMTEASVATETPVVITPEPTPTEVPPMLEAYEPLYRRNHDLFGWLMIEDTDVNYPIMHTPRDSEYYLHKSFNRNYAYSGVPFMEGSCFPGCGNYLIYGHHMKNGTMFATIVNYADEAFWQEHPLINFDTLYEYGTYEVVAAFYSKVFKPDDADSFIYYRYTDLRDPAVFDEYMAGVRTVAIYDTGVEAVYGDQLITLSTCEYSVENGRFVVVARKIY